MELTIDDLLNSLKDSNVKKETILPNTKDTWRRIGSKDAFLELGLSPSEKEEFLSNWIEENGYENI